MILTPLDLAVICIPLILILIVALRMRRYLRSVADFLAAGRCASRYVICVAAAEAGAGVAGMVGGWETFQKTGFSLNIWSGFMGFVFLLLSMSAVVSFRFRETRCLTFHQFFEVRYSKKLRVFASALCVFSGMFTFGIVPGVSARFFVYFLHLPSTIAVLDWSVPTYAVIMAGLLLYSLFFSLSGGQISVMVTDCLEGVVSNIFYLVVAFSLLGAISLSQIHWAFTNNPVPGQSLVNPFDISGQQDFDGWYVILGLFSVIYFWRGSAGNAGFTAASKSAHESRMAGIVGIWRGMAAAGMGFLIGAGAITLLKHPDFSASAAAVTDHLQTLPTDQLQRQMRVPTALGLLLPSGARGALCAITLFGTLAGLGNAMHNFGSMFVQDVVLPNIKRKLEPHEHIRVLRASMIGVAIFSFLVSSVWTPPDYLQLAMAVISALYLGGVGAVVWGGLYWKRATAQGAWTSMLIGAFFATSAWFLQTFWNRPGGFSLNQYVLDHWGNIPQTELNTFLIGCGGFGLGLAVAALAVYLATRHRPTGIPLRIWIGASAAAVILISSAYSLSHPAAASAFLQDASPSVTVGEYLHSLDHWSRFPINGQYLSTGTMILAGLSFIIVSLLTCHQPFDMDRMLHRGKYAVSAAEMPVTHISQHPRWSLARLIGIDEYYTRGDKLLHYFTFFWGLTPNVCALFVILWNVFFSRWPDSYWFEWYAFWGLLIPLTGGVITTIWFTYGTTRDLIRLFRVLPTVGVNANDDGRVIGNANAGDGDPENEAVSTGKKDA